MFASVALGAGNTYTGTFIGNLTGNATTSSAVNTTNFTSQWAGRAATGAVASATTAGTALGYTGIVVTNGQVLTVPTNYFVASGVACSINQTGGLMTVRGNGTITTNTLCKGAVQDIVCDYYCPNGGVTAYNSFTNQNLAVTVSIQCIIADFNQANDTTMTWPWEYTTNQSDVFGINAAERINFIQLETFRTPTGGPNIWDKYKVPLIHWKTKYFYMGDCGKNNKSPTLNCTDGSSISADIVDTGNGASDSASAIVFELFFGSSSSNCFIVLDVGYLTSTCTNALSYVPGPLLFQMINDLNVNVPGVSPTNGIILPRCTVVNDQIAPAASYGSLLAQSAYFIGTFYDMYEYAYYTVPGQSPGAPSFYYGLLNAAGFSGDSYASTATNILAVGSTGVTNKTAINYLLSVTAGIGLALKDGNGNQFLTPVLGDTVPLKPGWRFTGTAVTGVCVQQ
jgi:hypothetical protein